MLQKDLLFPFCTIEDNVALPLIVKGVKKKEARQQAGKYFAGFGLEGTQKKYPAQLSGGMRQRAALLRTYLFSGSVALLDEPFSALDMLTKQSVHGWYLDVMEQIRLSTLFITHDIDEAVLLSDRIYLLTGNRDKGAKAKGKGFPGDRSFSGIQEDNIEPSEEVLGYGLAKKDFRCGCWKSFFPLRCESRFSG